MADSLTPQKQLWIDNLPKRASSAALILENEAGQVLIVKANYKSYWTFPGGFIDPGETPKQGAHRETLEEVGINVDSNTIEFVAVADRYSHYVSTYQFVFKAPLRMDDFDRVILQASEIEDFALVDREEVLSNNREYGKVIYHWAHGESGYIEQIFDADR